MSLTSQNRESAQIIYLPTAAMAPVIQARIRGRLPNAVASLKRVRWAREIAAYQAAQCAKSIERARSNIELMERMLHSHRYELIQAQQMAARTLAKPQPTGGKA